MSETFSDPVQPMRAAITAALADGMTSRSASPTAPVLHRATIPWLATSPLDWLYGLPNELRFYGATRSPAVPIEIGGAGVADVAAWTEPVAYGVVLNRLHDVLNTSSEGIRYYGGFRFSPSTQPESVWALFGSSRFIVPRWEYLRTPASGSLSLHFTRAEYEAGMTHAWLDQLSKMQFADCDWEDPFPPPQARHENPDYSGWERNIETALQAFREGNLEKIVLARKAEFLFGAPVDPIVLLRRLRKATPDCFHFCYMPAPNLAFVGASPERLYRRDGRALKTEAVAGTRMRGRNAEEDQRLAEQLLSSDKDLREHEFVRTGIRAALEPLSDEFSIDESPRLLRLARGQHLFSAAQAHLRPDVTDADILSSLQPTPALGGYPTAAALELIAELEPFDRGWYAAPVGWVSRDEAEFAVAIRSGLVQPRKLSLYSGAGIVAGSTPESEWEEIELKIRDFIKVLTAS